MIIFDYIDILTYCRSQVPALCCVGFIHFCGMMKKHAPSSHPRKYHHQQQQQQQQSQQQQQQLPSNGSSSGRPPSSLSRPTSSSAARAAATSRIAAISRSKRPVSSSSQNTHTPSSSSIPLISPTANCAFTFSPIPSFSSNATHRPLVLPPGTPQQIKSRALTEDDIDFIPDTNTLAMLYSSNSMNTPVKLSPEMEYESENTLKLSRDRRVQEMHNHYISASEEEKRLLEAGTSLKSRINNFKLTN